MLFKRWKTLRPPLGTAGAGESCDYSDIKFCELDLGDPASLSKALTDCDLVVHTAGPFQRKSSPEVLEAAIKAKVRKKLVESHLNYFVEHASLVLLLWFG